MSTMKKVTTTLGLALVNLPLFVPVVFAQEGAAAAGQMTDKRIHRTRCRSWT